MSVLDGLSRLACDDEGVAKLVLGRRVGLLAHPASVDTALSSPSIVENDNEISA